MVTLFVNVITFIMRKKDKFSPLKCCADYIKIKNNRTKCFEKAM